MFIIFLNLERKQKTTNTINKIKDNNQIEHSDNKGIMNYTALQTSMKHYIRAKVLVMAPLKHMLKI